MITIGVLYIIFCNYNFTIILFIDFISLSDYAILVYVKANMLLWMVCFHPLKYSKAIHFF
ncbi:hypothetical protein MtrunA17_Chr1g0159101 [Medicago truncatula]|uniref:Transmembrane protein n=1 Tax=Medicago truncatula TaxID=3880 RepID=A0A396JKX5_MEDTR|nr:hypothetical protein MtrunA17_Chr1g0159101 [Medicago truncatula]